MAASTFTYSGSDVIPAKMPRWVPVGTRTVHLMVPACRGGSKRGPRPPSKNSAPRLWPPMKFMIKHNLPLVRGGSLWQYKSAPAPPAAIMATLLPHPNVNPRTTTACVFFCPRAPTGDRVPCGTARSIPR